MKHFQRFFKWVKSLFKKKEETLPNEIPLEDAFRMWREQNSKRNGN